MARKSIHEQIANLDARAKALRAKQAKQERARDTRGKILLGSFVLYQLRSDADTDFSRRFGSWIRREIPGFITRETDKMLVAEMIGEPAKESRNQSNPGPGTSPEHAEKVRNRPGHI